MQPKYWLNSKTVSVFALVFFGGGADIVTQLINQDSIDWRSVALAVIGLVGIALRVVTKDAVTMVK